MFTDASFMFYMYVQHEAYTYNACHHMVTSKTVEKNRHVWSFLSHDKIFIPVHKHNNHWVLFVICPPDRKLLLLITYMIMENGMRPFLTILLGSLMITKDKKNSPKTHGLGICILSLSINNSTMMNVKFV
jgi:hypothetical protein